MQLSGVTGAIKFDNGDRAGRYNIINWLPDGKVRQIGSWSSGLVKLEEAAIWAAGDKVTPADKIAASSASLSVAVIVVVVVAALLFVGALAYVAKKRNGSDIEEDACSDTPNLFICHHKAGAGGVARLLKLMLLERNVSNVFLDR
jgi:hypothetical protein